MKTRHVLKLSCGITCSMTFDEETAHFDCEWSPRLPTRKLLPKIEREYIPRRNQIIEAWAARTGKKVMLISL
jgi:hypothetical protein